MSKSQFEILSPFISEARLDTFNRALNQRTRKISVVLENIYQSRNASAVMRTCDAMGIQDVHLIENINPWVFNRGVSKGTPTWLTLRRYHAASNPTEACIKTLKQSGYKLAVTSPHVNGFEAKNLPLDNPIALVMGTEFKGVSDAFLNAADYHVQIPMLGMAESLNISVAAGMILHRMIENLHSQPPENWQLNADEKAAILLEWTKKSVRHSNKILQHFESAE